MNREEMTIDEAKAIIRKEYLCVDRDCDIEQNCGKCDLMIPSKEPILEAYKMAIKALEQEPCRYWQNGKCNGNTEVCEDAISRQDVLDLAKKGVLVSNGNYESVCKAINELPSVNPQPCEDAISREDALMCLTGEIKETDTIEIIIARFARRIRKLPPVTQAHPNILCFTNVWNSDYINGIFVSWYTCPSCGYDTRNQQVTWSDRTHRAESEDE